MRFPVAAKMALHSAGATGGSGGSPTPPGGTAWLSFTRWVRIVRGEGVHLYDADGQAYLDAYNNVPSVGHCHPRVVEAIARQAAAEADPGAVSFQAWEGHWKVTGGGWSKLWLEVPGADVIGSYDPLFGEHGRIVGTLSSDGRTLTGIFRQGSLGDDKDVGFGAAHGKIELVISADGKQFTGKYLEGSEPPETITATKK